MIKKTRMAVIVIITVLISSACGFFSNKPGPDYCAVQYPVVLVHGIGFRDRTVFGQYWGKTPGVLKAHGAKVFTGRQDAFGDIASNAGLLKTRILDIINKTGAQKVNIIAHSRGGIESRYMISKLGMQDRVASLTTIASPHRGSVMADIIMKEIKDESILPEVLDFFARIIGDSNPGSYNAGRELTRPCMEKFNREVKDAGGVYYQSYTGSIDGSIAHPLWKLMFITIERHEKEGGGNDGLVSTKSATWGTFKGLMTCGGKARVTHADEVGMHALSGMLCFKSGDFYRELVHELKLKNF